eukprot:11581200-Alexandrium_andersonii.AAC.1
MGLEVAPPPMPVAARPERTSASAASGGRGPARRSRSQQAARTPAFAASAGRRLRRCGALSPRDRFVALAEE